MKSSVDTRVVADLSGLSPDALLAKVAASFRVWLSSHSPPRTPKFETARHRP